MNVVVTAKLAYNVTLEECGDSDPPFWEKSIWHWRIPLKLKIFIWLSLNNKVLTLDNLQRRVFSDSGLCILCKRESRTVSHIFCHCPFFNFATSELGAFY